MLARRNDKTEAMDRKSGLTATTLSFVVLALALVSFLTGCAERAPVEKDLPVLRNDLEGGKVEIVHEIPGENFAFVTAYSTDYDTARWRITDSKTLRMEARIVPASAGDIPEVFIEHVHIDCSIQSRLAGVDGLPQDSMDDRLHTGNQVGFWITEEYPYENVFIIEGYSQTLIRGWGFVSGSTGVRRLAGKRLTEKTLVEDGKVYASKVSVVYDLLIRNPGEEYLHTRSIVDEFLIPVAGGTQESQ